ncbi:phthiocerol/phenolphthiocerol synthesis type-I polyketide synthase D [Amycolatopsis marina]|uniref:Phthiocerol/phenolphthiocerol synthesis type-I polyketide synthase D n=1 Tax=Amycolatopsis marina TaxID=490629 RepID=A0A1I1B1S3_9PSEU|nr:type I polyketide synthase [Amycolatopsis marina]SFB44201.1 phthiocerol/phenolphthiocerol synthesis type-I polyketide synthase D [Amycolatopsis marina]
MTAAPGSEREWRQWLAERLANLLERPIGEAELCRPLQECGVSSRAAVGLAAEIGELCGAEVSGTLLWAAPTITDLARTLAGALPEPDDQRAAGSPGASGEPVAVVGVGCRFPGAPNAAEFWRLLRSGTSAIGEIPAGRWEQFAGGQDLSGLPRGAGVLEDIAGFDADFFGITPREAEVMDPQQRVLLEVAWEALADAAIPPTSLHGTGTGVFVGLSATEYSGLTMTNLGGIDAWSGTGAAAALAANRLSYVLGAHGPSLTIDTACSSSLVAVHQAVRSLASGESSAALACGVNLVLSPAITANFAAAGALAADGRCKPFDATADGIVRGEGCGVVVLKRLADARRAGDRVHAVIRGSEVNSDGRSNGIMAPNPLAQQRLLRKAYATAGVRARTVDYVEAHGTGTLLGDPIEAGALAEVLGAGRTPDRPLLLGSVKSNLGHLEGAAGIAGLIKVVLALRHATLPRSLHFTEPNPHIDFAAAALRVVAEEQTWPRYSGVARAGVSAFGFGGTNAHVVLEEWPRAVPRAGGDEEQGRPEVVALSARSERRLRTRAGALVSWLDAEPSGGSIADIAAAVPHGADGAHSDAPGSVRGAVVARDRDELRQRLDALSRSTPHPSVLIGQSSGGPTADGPVLVFSGHGSQWPGMGQRLLAEEPAFDHAVRALDADFAEQAGSTLSEMLTSGARMGELNVNQPVLFGMQVALAALWRDHGVVPAAVIGHSVGEVAAAVVAGALSAGQGLRVVLARSQLLAAVDSAGTGAMALVELTEAELRERAGRFPGVGIAVYAAPSQCTVSGPAEQVTELVTEVEAKGGLARLLPVGGAGHSAAVDPLLDRLTAALDGLRPARPTVGCYSSVLDDPRGPVVFDAAHWAMNLRRPVRFTQAVAAAVADGHRVFVEVSPHPIAARAIEQTAGSDSAVVIPTLRRGAPGDTSGGFAAAVAAMYLADGPEILRRRYPQRVVADLPPPVWEHRRFWAEGAVADAPERASGRHPMLGTAVEVPDGAQHLWYGDVGLGAHPWLADHGTREVAVFPGTGYVELALAAARDLLGEPVELRDVVLHRLLPLGEHTAVCVSARPGPAGTLLLTMFARVSGEWARHAEATAARDGRNGTAGAHRALNAGVDQLVPVPLYHRMDAAGQVYGPTFRGLRDVRATEGRAVAQVRQPDSSAYVLHPALADMCLHALAAAAGDPGNQLWVPTGFGRVRLTGDPRLGVTVTAELAESENGTRAGTVRLHGADGRTLVEIGDVSVAPLTRAHVPLPLEKLTYRASWESAAPQSPAQGRPVLLLHGDDDPGRERADALAAALAKAGDEPGLLPVKQLADLPRMLRARPGTGAVVVLTDDAPDVADVRSAQVTVLTACGVVRELAEFGSAAPRLWFVTGGGAAVEPGEPVRPGPAALHGLIRVLAFEHPELRASLLDATTARDIAVELAANGQDDEIAWRTGNRYVRRLRRHRLDVPEGAAPSVRAGAYVVTGGLGGLGLAAADWLAGRGATRVVLSARRAADGEARARIDRLRESGVDIVVESGDIAEPGVADELVLAATHDGLALRGVIHAAGVLADGTVLSLKASDLEAVWHAKAEGALRLHEACTALRLDWWVSYSSAAALFGSPGQTSYATANAWLDAFAAWQRAQGVPASSVQWGPWGEIGGAANRDNPLLDPLSPTEALAALGAVLAAEPGETAVSRVHTAAVLDLFPQLAHRPYTEILTSGTVPERATPATDWPGVHGLRELCRDEALAAVRKHIVGVVADLMRFDPALLDTSAPLTSLGLDSLLAMRARAAIERDLGLSLPMPLLLRGASLTDIAEYCAGDLGLAAERDDENSPEPRDTKDTKDTAAAGPGPRDFAERWVALQWRRVLGGAEPAVDVPFDQVAGQADRDRLSQCVSAELGAPVTVDKLFAVPTIAGMATTLRPQLEGHAGGAVRELAQGTDGGALFLFHPAGGSTAVYRPLVRLLDPEVACFGMERFTEPDDVEVKAARYLRLIRERRPHGPYRLGGWSFGGCLAYEVARQLTAEGEEVELLFLIDSILPLSVPGVPERELLTQRLRRFADQLEQTYQVSLGVSDDDLGRLDERAQVELVMRRMREAVPGIGDAVAEHQYTSYVDARIAERYRPGGYLGPVLLFRAAAPHPLTTSLDPRYLRTDAALGWDEYCHDLEIVRVPGDHISMIDPPNVSVIAERLNAALRPARTVPR